jgi:ParB-like chromosome segregation protein Spo0J
MAKPNEVLDRMTSAKLSPVFTIPLDQIKQMPEEYRHRADADLDRDKDSMQALMKSLTTEGQKDPVLVYKFVAKDGTVSYILVAGHRRLQALTLLAEANVPGFSMSMEVKACEILDGHRHDYLLWSVADNVIREQIDELHRVKAALLLLSKGVDHTRIRVNLKLSDSTFERYRRLAQSPWMFGHVERNEIGLTDAHLLLEAAGGNGGAVALEHLRKDLARLVAVAKTKIQDKREELAERQKDLKGSEALVKSYFQAYLVKKWVLDLKQGRRIQARAKFVYPATIETDKLGKKLIIPAVSGVYLIEKNLEQLAEIVVKLDRVLKDVKPQVNALARQRLALVDYQEDDGPTDFASAGLDAVAEILNPRSAPLYPDDGVTLEDREATLREVNENYDREDRQIVPATDGIDIPDAQPQSDESDAE